jgi:PAS domain S-box-containing protein
MQLRVLSRPNKKVDIGPIDAACPLLLCDLQRPDTPIVYTSDAFLALTGYRSHEVMGRNCRFLQAPGNKQVRSGGTRDKIVNLETVRSMRRAIERNEEMQVEILNYKKDGRQFRNLLTIVPVRWRDDSPNYQYSVGFQCDLDAPMVDDR